MILMEEKVFVGYGYGRFKNDRGEMQDYCNVFVLEDFNGTENADYRFGGQKAVKYRCVNAKVFDGVKIGDRVQCYFDGRGRISFMVSLEGKDA